MNEILTYSVGVSEQPSSLHPKATFSQHSQRAFHESIPSEKETMCISDILGSNLWMSLSGWQFGSISVLLKLMWNTEGCQCRMDLTVNFVKTYLLNFILENYRDVFIPPRRYTPQDSPEGAL